MMDGPVNPVDYNRLFTANKTGEEIFLELHAIFYQQQSHTPGDPYTTAFKEGQRSVVSYLVGKIGQGALPEAPEEGDQ
jgi:hypothetical protein